MAGFNVNELPQRAKRIASKIGEKMPVKPCIGLILGSGWGGIAAALKSAVSIPYSELPEMPACGVAGHAGNFVFGSAENKQVAVVQGRFHLYEGHSEASAVLTVRVLYELGVRTVILTNAAGGINPNYSVGDLMILNDHINFTCRNPLIGLKPTAEFPDRFVDMTAVYDRTVQNIIREECVK